jgi:thiol-disulfide isomerase/thioredoxin
MIVSASVVGYLIYAQASQTQTTSTGILGSPISPAIYQNLTGVYDSTLSAIGVNQSGTTPPVNIASPTTPQPLVNLKPEIFYIGAEWCPYCAAERWALIVALSKFGNFTNLEYMQSAADEGSIATFTFKDMNYTSKYLSFVAVETEDRNHNTIASPSAEQTDIWTSYTSSDLTIPFIYVYGVYIQAGSQYLYNDLQGLNWTQIASQLNNPSSTIAKLIDGSANEMIGAICTALSSKDWPRPTICGASFAQVAFVQRAPPEPKSGISTLLLYMNQATTVTKEIRPRYP